MNKQEALGFAVSSAIAALDNGDGFADPINEHRTHAPRRLGAPTPPRRISAATDSTHMV